MSLWKTEEDRVRVEIEEWRHGKIARESWIHWNSRIEPSFPVQENSKIRRYCIAISEKNLIADSGKEGEKLRAVAYEEEQYSSRRGDRERVYEIHGKEVCGENKYLRLKNKLIDWKVT